MLDKARLHPTGRHWVDNFLVPTLLVHQFERSEREGDVLLKMLTLKRMMKYFFVAGHYHYARYLTQYLLEWSCLNEDDKVDLVCRHSNGVWNAVSADQFGEQTAIRIGKGSLKGMTLSPELVSEWIDSFPITAHISDCMNHIYKDDIPKSTSMKPHKEELRHHRSLDTYDRNLIYTEVEKYSHPLDDDSPHLFNPITGQIANVKVNLIDSIYQ